MLRTMSTSWAPSLRTRVVSSRLEAGEGGTQGEADDDADGDAGAFEGGRRVATQVGLTMAQAKRCSAASWQSWRTWVRVASGLRRVWSRTAARFCGEESDGVSGEGCGVEALKVAEVFRTLHALYPGRVDLGIGRAPGGGPVEALALKRDRKTQMADDFPEQVQELLAYLGEGFPERHPFAKMRVAPEMPGAADVWMLGSSMWSSAAASGFGLPYAFAHFFSPVSTRAAIEAYKRGFLSSGRVASRKTPEATVAVGVVCAETQEEAEYLSASVKVLQRRIRLGDRRPVAEPSEALKELQAFGPGGGEDGEWPRYFVGTPAKVGEELRAMAGELGIGEVVVNSIVWDHAARVRSYELLAREFGLA
jgi:luciferase family oxidoreductase group 1